MGNRTKTECCLGLTPEECAYVPGRHCSGMHSAALPSLLSDPRVVALVEALRPFAACVFNDNGDVTISTGHLTMRDWLRLCEAAKGEK